MNSSNEKEIIDAGEVNQQRFKVFFAMISLALSMLMASLGTSITNVSLPTLAKVFNATFQDVQWVVLTYLLSITALIVTVGKVGDIFGRRNVLIIGLLIFTISSLVCGISNSLEMLMAARIFQGLGAAIMMALTMAFVGETVPKDNIGRAMGLLGAMSATGTALGPSIGGILIAKFSWASIFFINVPIGFLTIFLVSKYLSNSKKNTQLANKKIDVKGTFVLVLTLVAYALSMTSTHGRFGLFNIALISLALLGVYLFLHVEKSSQHPLINLSMFHNPDISLGLFLSMIVMTVMITTLVVGPFYLSNALRLNPESVGLIMSVGPLAAAFSGVPAGKVVDQFGFKKMMIVGVVGIAIGSMFLSIVPIGFGVKGYIIPLVIMTISYSLFQTANNTSVMKDIQFEQRGSVSGLLNLSRNLGLFTGASVMGLIFSLASKSSDVNSAKPEAIAFGMNITFSVAVCMLMICVAVIFFVRKNKL